MLCVYLHLHFISSPHYHILVSNESAPNVSPLTHSHTHTHQALQVPLLVVWCTPGGVGPYVLTLLEHSYCMLEGQLEVLILKKEEEQTTSVYQNNHSTPPTLLGHRVEGHTCTGLSMKLEEVIMLIVHFNPYIITMHHVQCATLQHEKQLWWFLLELPAHHPGPKNTMDISWQRNMIIIVQPLSVWTGLQSHYLATEETQMELYSSMLNWSAAMEFLVHHSTHRRNSHV